MSNHVEINGREQIGSEDEFVVPHMDACCLTNSLAYQKVLEEPWTYLHNWSAQNASIRNNVLQHFLTELNDIRSNLAVPVNVSQLNDENRVRDSNGTEAEVNN